MSYDRASVRAVLDKVKAEGRASLTPSECKTLCASYGIAQPKEEVATSSAQAARIAGEIGFPVAMKIVSPDILHKSDAGGVLIGVKNAADAEQAYGTIVSNAKKHSPRAKIDGVLVQQMLAGGHEVIIGALTDPSFGKVVAFGLGGVLVEVLKDVTFRLAPATEADALAMLDGIAAAEILRGVRGGAPIDRASLAKIIVAVSHLVTDFPEIHELDLNPVFATPTGAAAADVRVIADFAPHRERYRPSQHEILLAMNRIMKPDAVAVIGASPEDGKIGNSVMKNLINGGYRARSIRSIPRCRKFWGARLTRASRTSRVQSTSRCSRFRLRWWRAR